MKRRLLHLVVALMAFAATTKAQSLSVATIEAMPGTETTITVNIAGATEMTALQCNLQLPEGLTLAGDIALGDAAKGHTLSTSTLASGDLLIVLYDLYQSTFTDGTLLTIPVVAAEDPSTTEGTLHKVRTATIAAQSKALSDVKFTAVVETPVVEVAGITLDQTAATLTEGETLTLKATVSPDDATDKTVTWETSDAAIATVENGVVTAVAAGTATITAKAGDKEATCVVNVEKKVIAVSGIALDQTAATITEGETLTLKATVSPDDATDKTVTWSSSNVAVATVENGVVTALAPGTATITAKAGDKEATCVVTVEAAAVEPEPEPTVASGEYYLYHAESKRFLARGEHWGTCATVDRYGIPFVWTAEEYSLKFLDSNVHLFETDDSNIYTDNASTGFAFEEVEGGYLLKSQKSNRYLTIVDAAFTHDIVNVTDDASAAVVWQLKSKAEHDAIVAGYVEENYMNVIKAAGLTTTAGDFASYLATLNAEDKTSAIGTARFNGSAGDWTFTEVRHQDWQPAYGADFCELWQATGSYTQTLTGLAEGIYKVTVQGYERSGGWAECNALGEKGYEITTATLSANGEEVNFKSWLSGKTDENNPDNTGQAVAKFNEGKYMNEVYTYVGADGTLTLTVCKPSHVGGNWVLFNNFTLTCYAEAVCVPVTGITLSQTAATLTEGETLTLKATVSPDDATDKTVTWSSSNVAVATVENGVVTALAPGTATITAKAGDKEATCVVTVEKKVIAVSGIALDQTAATITEGETLTLTATIAPADATDKTVTWSSSNVAVATVADGVVTALAAGTATITAKAGDKEATCVVTVTKKEEPLPTVASGEYYLFHAESKRFLARGEHWGTCATVDRYGIPFVWTAEEYSLKFLDSNVHLFETDDSNIYTDNASTGFAFEEVEGGYLLKSQKSNRYLTIVDAAFTHDIVNVTDDASAAVVWQLKSKAEHDAIVAGYVEENYMNVIKAASLTATAGDFADYLATLTAEDMTSAIGTARFAGSAGDWTFTEVRHQDWQPAYGADFCELWQATGSYTQTLTGLAEGIYKVTVQGYERSGGWAECNALGEKGYEITTATLSANGEEVNLKSWLSGKTDENNPDNTGQAVAKFNEGKYMNEVYTYVGADGTLTLTVCKPSHVGGNWVLFNNFTLTRYAEESTGIESSVPEAQGSQLIYDLTGRRVTHPTKGIYIVNGRKVVIK